MIRTPDPSGQVAVCLKLKMIVNFGEGVRSPTRGPQTGSPAGVGAVREGKTGDHSRFQDRDNWLLPNEFLLTRGIAETECLFGRSIEDGVDYVEGDHAATDHRAGRDGAPEHISPGKIPNCEQASHHRYQNAGARSPEGYLRDYARIEKASLHLQVYQGANRTRVLLNVDRDNSQVGAHGTELSDRCDAQWQVARVFADPDADLKSVGLRIVSRQ